MVMDDRRVGDCLPHEERGSYIVLEHEDPLARHDPCEGEDPFAHRDPRK